MLPTQFFMRHFDTSKIHTLNDGIAVTLLIDVKLNSWVRRY